MSKLCKAGASVSLIESGVEFLEQGGQNDYSWDVIILDYQMPGLNGLQTLQAMSADMKMSTQYKSEVIYDCDCYIYVDGIFTS